MKALIWWAIIVAVYFLLLVAHGFYLEKIAKKITPSYLQYDDYFSSLQSERDRESLLLNDLVVGVYSEQTLNLIDTYKKHHGHKDGQLSDKEIIKFFIDQCKKNQQQSFENLTLHWTRMRDILSKAWFVSSSDIASPLQLLLEKSESTPFTMHDFSEMGQFQQPDYSSSLRWELQMLFDEGRIPKAKNYTGLTQ